MSAPTVRLGGVGKRFRGTVALADVDLTLKPGITGLLGPCSASWQPCSGRMTVTFSC